MPFPCRAHAIPLPCRAAKSLECVFPIWFTQRGCVWFTFVMPCQCPCHAPTMPFFSRPQHRTAVSRRPCCALALRRTAWSEHGMGMAWQVWIRHGLTVSIKWERHIPNPSGAAWQGNGMSAAWERHAMCESALTHWGRVTQICVFTLQLCKTDDANLRF